MKFSVLIPAYNAAATIRQTVDSVLTQELQPYEILVFDDGSTDNTAEILESYAPRITVFRQPNQSVESARNFLCRKARGDILAFLDADDLWHPSYLYVQRQQIEAFPEAVGYFTEHANLVGHGNFQFNLRLLERPVEPRVVAPITFVAEYNKRPLSFQMSCFCLPRRMLDLIEGEPFCSGGGGDTYLHTMLPLLGPVVHTPLPLVAYRIIDSSLSANQLRSSLVVVGAIAKLDAHYRKRGGIKLYREFKLVAASRRRTCGRYLMSHSRMDEARTQFRSSLSETGNLFSRAKSLGMLSLSFLPAFVQSRGILKRLWSTHIIRTVPSKPRLSGCG